MKLRVVALAGFPAFVGSVAACAAVLGIEDRVAEPNEGGVATDANVEDTTTPSDAGADAADVELPFIDGAICETVACEAAGGKCVDKLCQFDCSEGCDDRDIVCPPGNDCLISCTKKNGCNQTSCSGVRSCQIVCSVDGSCTNVKCSANACAFTCNGPDNTCAGGVACDASDCRFDCSGKHSCDDGVSANGSANCAIHCTGMDGCSGDLSCGGNTSQITCGSKSCSGGVPQCTPKGGQSCVIDSTAGDNTKFCCDAGGGGTCTLNVKQPNDNCK